MSAKTLPIQNITNELEGASLYFHPTPGLEASQPAPVLPDPSATARAAHRPHLENRKGDDKLSQPIGRQASKHARTHASMQESLHPGPHTNVLASKPAGEPDIKQVSEPAGVQVTPQASLLAGQPTKPDDDLIETVRKTVKQVGKEQLFVRLTPAEKDALRATVHALNELYRGRGRKTSENEVSRIAIKFLLEDYYRNGAASILALTQAVLNA